MRWRKQVYPNSSSHVEANRIVCVEGGGTHHCYALDAATGSEVWKFPIPNGPMVSSPLIIDNSGEADYSGDSGESNNYIYQTSAGDNDSPTWSPTLKLLLDVFIFINSWSTFTSKVK